MAYFFKKRKKKWTVSANRHAKTAHTLQSTFAFAVLANVGRLLRAFRRRMSLSVANTAGSFEHTRLGAFRLGVAGGISASWFFFELQCRWHNYPCSPQLKHSPSKALRGSVHSRAKCPGCPQLFIPSVRTAVKITLIFSCLTYFRQLLSDGPPSWPKAPPSPNWSPPNWLPLSMNPSLVAPPAPQGSAAPLEDSFIAGLGATKSTMVSKENNCSV